MYKRRYKLYVPDRGWLLKEFIWIMALMGIASYVFYNSFLGIPFMLPAGILLWRHDDKRFISSRKARLREEFKDMTAFLSGNLNAGYSLENSFANTAEELDRLYGTDCLTLSELKRIIYGISCNERIEELFRAFGERSDIDEIRQCAELMAVTKCHGGDMIEVIRQISRSLNEQYTARNEIDTAIAAKRLEGRIMLCMPFAIVMYMRFTNEGYMDILYTTLLGKVVMTVLAMFVMLAFMITEKITEIEV